MCVCVVSQFDISITKQNNLFVRCRSSILVNIGLCLIFVQMSVFVQHFFAMFKSAIMEVELDDGGKHDKTTDGEN